MKLYCSLSSICTRSARVLRSRNQRLLGARKMATVRSKLSHEERTAMEPRAGALQPVILSKIEQANESVRLLRLSIANCESGVKFLPGQWLDTFIPGLSKAGGFTITSTPEDAKPASPLSNDIDGDPYLELAIQNSPKNPPAAWLWRPAEEILGSQLLVRVGGSFVYPPLGVPPQFVRRLVFVAGGVGVNPLVSTLSHLHRTKSLPQSVHFLYSTKVPGPTADLSKILFYSRLRYIAAKNLETVRFSLFATNTVIEDTRERGVEFKQQRLKPDDLRLAIGPVPDRGGTFCYVCGPQNMTDEIVDFLKHEESVAADQVLCEKWW